MRSRPSFLAPLLSAGAREALALRNARTGAVLATTLEAALDSRSRRRGLLGRESLEPGHALLIAPCAAIHTFAMRFAIDVVFLRRDGRVRRVCRGVRPGRIAVAPGAYAVVELAAGALDDVDAAAGDPLEIVERPGDGVRLAGA